MTNTVIVLKLFLFDFTGASVKLAWVGKIQTVFFLGRQMGVKVQGAVRGGPNGKSGNWGWEFNRLLVLRKQQLQNAGFCKESWAFACVTYKCPEFSEWASLRILWLDK